MLVTEVFGFEEAAAEDADDVADHNLAGGARERVAAYFAARAGDETAATQEAQQLGGIGRRERFRSADFGNGQALVPAGQADAQQAA